MEIDEYRIDAMTYEELEKAGLVKTPKINNGKEDDII